MIDWYFVGVNSLWILGCSIILAAFSYLDWWAQETQISRRELFTRPGWRVPFNGGLLLVCLGVGLGRGRAWWEYLLWAALGITFAWYFGSAAREMRAESLARPPEPLRTDSSHGCPNCRSMNLHRSRSRGPDEERRKQDTTERLFRCHDCDWRGWLEP